MSASGAVGAILLAPTDEPKRDWARPGVPQSSEGTIGAPI
jgi:hypothetical protein